ncbi:hypothetical protein WALSEDRAFT_53616 [Wallemia mellicola CBS 633.66]|nr:hypothetical protein WALSEDRAFT_53616 [Wallemia mellicola CBS 633.66]EIM23335.1 hypothetical protein WALSEDRAFT_53616 [Wallemia mellicola CBS 633.66]|eukprot:XP_006956719.1 hypothetical protein WALSEDRAFT_53616 [Wallemia mellicola CBS 633.66]
MRILAAPVRGLQLQQRVQFSQNLPRFGRTSEQELKERNEQPESPPPTAHTGIYTRTSEKIEERTETEEADSVEGPLKDRTKGRSGSETISEENVRSDHADDPLKNR